MSDEPKTLNEIMTHPKDRKDDWVSACCGANVAWLPVLEDSKCDHRCKSCDNPCEAICGSTYHVIFEAGKAEGAREERDSWLRACGELHDVLSPQQQEANDGE